MSTICSSTGRATPPLPALEAGLCLDDVFDHRT
jgi:hypothetical protein